jgi:hypothetical protein
MHDEGRVTKIGALSALFNWANKLESICKAINRIKQFSDSLANKDECWAGFHASNSSFA